MKRPSTLLIIMALAALSACATSANSALDNARFQLDNCTPTNTGPCDAAISSSDSIPADNENYYYGLLIKSSAYATRAGVGILDLIVQLAKSTTADNQSKFRLIRNAFSTINSYTDLRSSISTLSAVTAPDTASAYYTNFYFQLGMLRSIEAFAMPTAKAQPVIDGPVTVNDISEADRLNAQNDFIDGDPDLGKSGITDASSNGWDLRKTIRQNYCVLHNASAPAAGFTVQVLRDLIACQLCETGNLCGGMNVGDPGFPFQAVADCTVFNFTVCENAPAPAL